VFGFGFLIRDLPFAVLIGIWISIAIIRENVYGITMNWKYAHYGLIIITGSLQQMSGSLVCDLYPQNVGRMMIIYVSMGITVFIDIMVMFEIVQQRKLLAVQLELLFMSSGAEVIDEDTSFRMDHLSVPSAPIIPQ